MEFKPRPALAPLRATIAFDGVVTFIYTLSPDVHKVFSVSLGQVFKVSLTGAPRAPIDWSASNDEVLAIEDDSGPKARITATEKGVSHIDLKVGKRIIGILVVEVTPERGDEPTRFISTVGEETPDV